ncbi:MAG: DUF3617 domain-containing protein [Candidatus Omnitrophica bacterium]|nr:DUF3617 domain-containing protein [Candidatus Omnitrophota bacterium]
MNKCILAIVVVLFLGGIQSSVAKAQGMKEGKWSMTVESKMEGMTPEYTQAMKQMENMPPEVKAMMQKNGVSMSANGQGVAMTYTQCLTKQNPVPKGKDSAKYNCQETHEMNGDTVSFHMSCHNGDMSMEGEGHMTYSGDTMEGETKMKRISNGKEATITMHTNGQYLGACS